MRIKQLYITVILALLSVVSVSGQSKSETQSDSIPEITSDLKLFSDTTNIRIGEQINLSIVVETNQTDSNEITWPIAADTLTKYLEVIGIKSVDTVVSDEFISYNQQWVITCFEAGTHYVPAFNVVINGEEHLTDSILIFVETMEVDTTQAIKNIKGVEEVPISIIDWIKHHWQILSIIAVLAILIFGVYMIIKKRKKIIKAPKKKEIPKIPPFITAINRLSKLQNKEYWKQNEIKKHHSKISEILREYLEYQFNFPALEQTTAEVMRDVRFTQISQEQQNYLQRILMLTDLVKYAKERPEAEENINTLNLAINFVKANKPEDKPDDQNKKEAGNET